MALLLVGTEVERRTLLSAPLSTGQGAWGFGFADIIGHRSGAVPTRKLPWLPWKESLAACPTALGPAREQHFGAGDPEHSVIP